MNQIFYKSISLVLATLVALVFPFPNYALAFEAQTVHHPGQKFSNNQSIEALTVADARKIVQQSKETKQQAIRQKLTVQTREPAIVTAPSLQSPLVLEGEASYYSRAGCLGCSPNLTMANGQPLNDNALTMAIGADKKHLVGRKARVTNLATNMSVDVTITDTGGFYKAKYGHRVADLTIATKQAIGMAGGVGQVRVEVF